VTVLKAVGTILLATVAAIAVDIAVLSQRVQREPVRKSAAVSSTYSKTWLVVGVDDKPVIDPATNQTVGDRADVIIVVQVPDDGGQARILSIPRNLTVRYDAEGHMERLTLLLKPGIDTLIGGLCEGMGIPVDHVAMVSMSGMVNLVDAVGGVWMDIEYPMHDDDKGLDIPKAGHQLLDGTDALGLLRARTAERKIDGKWIPFTEDEGNAARARYSGELVDSFVERFKQVASDPVKLQQIAFVGTGAVTIDDGTTAFDIASIAPRVEQDMQLLPVEAMPMDKAEWTSYMNDETLQVLAGFDYYPGGGCKQAQ
jgi:LCP family protein required for cell wall assembly